MARAIVRWSINGEANGHTHNQVTQALSNNGFSSVGTAAYEAEDAPLDVIHTGIQAVLAILTNPPGGGTLDHIWIYVDS